MAKSNGASPQESAPTSAAWAEREAAAYRTAEQQIGFLPAGEAIVYHEGNLAVDIGNDPEIAGRAAAFRAAAEAARGRLAQRRLGFECYQYIFWRSHGG